MKKIFKHLLIPILLVIPLFLLIRPLMAQENDIRRRLLNHLVAENVAVGEEIKEGRTQVYYEFEGDKKFISDISYNNKQPATNGEYITYVREINGEGQIFLYHIPSENTVQLTKVGTNLNPGVSRLGKVVWEGWVFEDASQQSGGTWQVFAFDGTKVRQITQGDIAINPSVYGDYALFSRKSSVGEWRSEVYSFTQNDTRVVAIGFQNKTVELVGDKISYTDGGVFPLEPEDFFLLNIDTNITPSEDLTVSPDISISPTATPTIAANSETEGVSTESAEVIE